jgi:hypothetical protein
MKTDQEVQQACKEVFGILPQGAIVNVKWLTDMTVVKVSADTHPDASFCGECYRESTALNGESVKTWITKSINSGIFLDKAHGGIVLTSDLLAKKVRPRPYHIEKSPIHGFGLFASRKIRSGERITSASVSFSMSYKNWHGFNHSCNPNMVLDQFRQWSPVALRDIKKGEEMTVYYGSPRNPSPLVSGASPTCNCGSKSCPNYKK